jgi:hypothetical protein
MQMTSWKDKLKSMLSSITDKEEIPVIENSYLQNTRPGNKGECDLVIGLDFGTSSTKVVIQAPDLPGQPSYAVKFGKLSDENTPYLLPTKLWVSDDGFCSLKEFDGSKVVDDIKLELFSKDENLKSSRGPGQQELCPQEVATCYLALTLWASRRWYFEKKSDLIKQFSKFYWNINLGVPSPCIEDNEENRMFRRVGEAAWKLSTIGHNSITLEAAKIILSEYDEYGHCILDDNGCTFDIIPEIAAGAIGYALSNLRQEGLHVMIDVGSSTVDACSFILNKRDGSDSYSLLISDVKPYGTFKFYKEHLLAMQNVCKDHAEGLRNKFEPMASIDEDVKHFIINENCFMDAFQESREKLKQELLYMLRVVIWQTRCRRDPNSPIWRNGRLPVLLIGGGNRMEFFRIAIKELNDWLIYHTKNNGINFMFPPIPDSLTDSVSDEEQYNLLAVAWGLSHRSLDIGDIIPADQIKDVKPPPPRDYSHKFVGKELT